MTEHVSITTSTGRGLPGVLQRPQRARRGPIVLVTDIYGPIDFYLGLAGRLGERGHPTLVVDYLSRAGGLESHNREHALARARRLDQRAALGDLATSIRWLRGQTGAGDRVGVLGFCLGGTLALDLAAEQPGLAVVTYYAFPAGVPGRNPAPAPLEVVPAIEAPVLAFWGQEDYMDLDAVRRFCASMADSHDDFESFIYPDVGHSFLAAIADGDGPARDSWHRAEGFFAERLPSNIEAVPS